MASLHDLTDLMAALRNPQSGCPWDIRQTHQSISAYTLEETYELLHAIESGDSDHLREELGDLLFECLLLQALREQEGGEPTAEDRRSVLVRLSDLKSNE